MYIARNVIRKEFGFVHRESLDDRFFGNLVTLDRLQLSGNTSKFKRKERSLIEEEILWKDATGPKPNMI